MAEIAEMREVVINAFSSKDKEKAKTELWPKKVRKMGDSQVIAIYLDLQTKERRKARRREWEDVPWYTG